MVSDDGLSTVNAAEPDIDAESGDSADCQSAEDFYAYPARDAIGRHCRRILDENALTPSELLHSARHQLTVSNLATFVGILSQVDRTMKRKGAINALVNDVAKLTRERLKPVSLPDLTPGTVTAAIAGLLRSPGTDGRFLAEAAIAQTLQPYRTFGDKARALLALALGTEDADALSFLDRFLGEIVRSDVGLASIAADQPFPALVDCVVTLITADHPLGEGAPAALIEMETVLARASMPVLTESLLIAFRRLLRREDHFTIAAAGDLFGIESVQREILELSRFATRLRSDDGFRGGAATEAALERRGALLVNEDTLHEIIRGRGFIQKLRTLFMLQKMPLPATARGAVNSYLLQFFQSREFAGRLLDCWKDRSEKLKGLAEVQKLVLASTIPPADRQAFSQMLDDVQGQFMRTFHVLTPLVGKAEPQPEQVVEVLKLAAEDAFCKGRSRLAVARALYRQVHRPRFLRAFLQQAGKDRTARIAWLRSALGAVGVPFIDLSAMKVLVVDDEPAPRAFVKSALFDMGVVHIEEASDGQDAIERIDGRLGDYALIICDWMMPRLSGIDVLKWVRERRADLPFLMVTALATPKAVTKAIELHVSGYIAKPFSPDQLEDKVFFVLMGGSQGG